ncbi:hypothetical protein [Hyphococcus sp.]|uniref:hypothetical protein n=1 Tax=Hyphococcus sp. TaxID=2038636 RepID=UPI0035C68BA7
MHDQDDDKPGVLSRALTVLSLASFGYVLFEVATDSSRPSPLLDAVVHIIVAIAGVAFIAVLMSLLAQKEIDNDAIEDPNWQIRAKFAFAVLIGIAAMFGVLYAYRFWLT